MELSLVIPAYNEARTIAATVTAATAALARLSGDFEVVVVDDGSGDETASIARGLAAADGRLRVLAHSRRSGKGAAVRTSSPEARRSAVRGGASPPRRR